MDLSNLIPDDFYVVGRRKKHSPHNTILKLTRTPRGWNQRVTEPALDDPALNVEYVSRETRQEIAGWMVCDFNTRFRLFDSIEEAQEYRDQWHSRL